LLEELFLARPNTEKAHPICHISILQENSKSPKRHPLNTIETLKEDGHKEIEHLTYDYQFLEQVFKHIVAKIIMSSGRLPKDIKDMILVLVGGDDGVGPF
jgi:hypothetical protein